MGVLANLMPGLRNLRGPLAAGLVWLLVIWLALSSVPEQDTASGVWQRLLDLDGVLSAVGVPGAIGFGAYLLGSISETVVAGCLSGIRLVRYRNHAPLVITLKTRKGDRHQYAGIPEPLSSKGRSSLVVHLNSRLHASRQLLVEGGLTSERAFDVLFTPVMAGIVDMDSLEAGEREEAKSLWWGGRDLYLQAVRDEFPLIRLRMLGKEPELFSEIDRARSEAELREAIAPPALALALVLGLKAQAGFATVAWVCGGLAVMVLLLAQARIRRREAGDALVDALVIGRVDAPALDRLATAVEQATRAA